MRLVLVGAVCLVLASCAQRVPRELVGDGELVLEIGGGGASLSRLLQKSGVELLPAPEPLPHPAPDSESKGGAAVGVADASARRALGEGAAKSKDADSKGAGVDRESDAQKDGHASAKPEETAKPSAAEGEFDVIEVALGANETLMDLASKHLGTAKRFKDIMKWNGWSDRDTRRLKAGTKVKIHKPRKLAASK